jgi:hypothetical protein
MRGHRVYGAPKVSHLKIDLIYEDDGKFFLQHYGWVEELDPAHPEKWGQLCIAESAKNMLDRAPAIEEDLDAFEKKILKELAGK